MSQEEYIMRRTVAITILCVLISIPIFLGGGCNGTAAQKGAVGGAAVGAIGGQLVGGNTKSTMIGAGVGALGGALLNDALEKG
jgi:osmotically inducible lipoprotein OsmB